jgi:hypothetical protein
MKAPPHPITTEAQALGGAFSPYPGLVAIVDRGEEQDLQSASNWDMLLLGIAISTVLLLYLIRS